MPTHGRRRWAAATLAAAGMAVAGGATAHADSFPRVAMEEDGTAHLSWRADHPTEYRTSMFARSRSRAGVYTEPRWLSPGTGIWAYGGDVHVDPAGAVTYVWDRGTDPSTVYARRRAPDGALGPLQTVAPPGGSQGVAAVDGRGAAVFAWTQVDDEEGTVLVQYRRRYPAGGLGPVRTLSEPGRISILPEAAVDAAGNALVVWHARDEIDEPPFLQARRIAADGTLGPVRSLTEPGSGVEDARVAFDGDGNAFVSYLRVVDRRHVPELIRRPARGGFGPAQRLSNSSLDAYHLRLAVGRDGAAAVTWTNFGNETGNVVRGRHRRPDGTLGTVMTLSEGGGVHSQVAIDSRGATTFVWRRHPGYQVQARRRSALGAVGPAQPLSSPYVDASDPRVAVDGEGNAMVVWDEGSSIRGRRRTAAGTLGQIETISGP